MFDFSEILILRIYDFIARQSICRQYSRFMHYFGLCQFVFLSFQRVLTFEFRASLDVRRRESWSLKAYRLRIGLSGQNRTRPQ